MSYKVFLTKSSEAAYAISNGYKHDSSNKPNSVKSVQCGCADGEGTVPAIYHNKGYFYCAVTYENMDGREVERYELIVC